METGVKDVKGKMIKVGDTVRSKWIDTSGIKQGFSGVVTADENNWFSVEEKGRAPFNLIGYTSKEPNFDYEII